MSRKDWSDFDPQIHNAKVAIWRDEEARRAATLEKNLKQIGQFASGVPGSQTANRTVQTGKADADGCRLGKPGVVKSGAVAPERFESSPSVAASTGPTPCLVGKTTSKQPKESAIQKLVGLALELHPRMAWHARMNSGAMTVGQRFIRFAFKGCSDFIGQTVDGRFVAVEVKRPDGKLTEDQISFLGKVSRNGGIAFVARSADDVAKGLG